MGKELMERYSIYLSFIHGLNSSLFSCFPTTKETINQTLPNPKGCEHQTQTRHARNGSNDPTRYV
ncbi:uncharacterized protein K460DRAFT_360750 [Cucurbitaria berberidis CBS 394.84]|uniref:Uncharacterized protein n=1 Tax=Cucurbitaria berberidis CBS 394.84 TaxID=1168544 RepID=A0A9P4GNU0_9PLEO|nr:uncharacterized protein K460DRAFT_360750 [Cucurbitaria berberidis CBS 394.84]KAF1849903.1 hypothetical protein K460DRAFT_360750 [Cucurbitaria berberidis CBS 394.84]